MGFNIETFFMCYVVYWYFSFVMYAFNKIRFIREARPDGCLIQKKLDIKYVFIRINGTVKVSVDSILTKHIKFMQIMTWHSKRVG